MSAPKTTAGSSETPAEREASERAYFAWLAEEAATTELLTKDPLSVVLDPDPDGDDPPPRALATWAKRRR